MSKAPPSSSLSPLQHSKPNAILKNSDKETVYKGKKSKTTFHIFVNETDTDVDLFWFYEGGQKKHGSIASKSNVYVGTYTYHQWKIVHPNGHLLGVYTGDSATITVRENGCHIQVNGLPVGSMDQPEEGCMELQTPLGPFRKRGTAMHMNIWAFDCVAEEAVDRLAYMVHRMLEFSPPDVVEGIQGAKASLAIFGKDQVLTDVPAHAFMKHDNSRDLDLTCRGLGATLSVPVTSIAEENLTMIEDELYPCQSICVHELGHAVLNLGLNKEDHRTLCEVFSLALSERLYPSTIYMMSNEQEYWATATEAWFQSTIRVDVNGGINTREQVKTHDPRMAALLHRAYGDGPWRFVHDCPAQLRFPSRKKQKSQPSLPASAKPEAPSTTAAAPDRASHQTTGSGEGQGLPAPARGVAPCSAAAGAPQPAASTRPPPPPQPPPPSTTPPMRGVAAATAAAAAPWAERASPKVESRIPVGTVDPASPAPGPTATLMCQAGVDTGGLWPGSEQGCWSSVAMLLGSCGAAGGPGWALSRSLGSLSGWLGSPPGAARGAGMEGILVRLWSAAYKGTSKQVKEK